MMPTDLVLVRHGQSEGNLAVKHSKRGDHSDFQGEFLKRHSSLWRLTDLGIKQAQAAGNWIRLNIGSDFGRFYSSEYLRAMETAAHLELPDAVWYSDFLFRERDRGALDVISHEERDEHFTETMQRNKINPFFWRPPEGESMADLCLRIGKILDTLHRECSDKKVIIVCHGEVMWAFRVRLERMPISRYLELDASKQPFDRIHNGQIIHYTRVDPRTEKLGHYLNWFRSVCPTDLGLSSNEWEPIKRRHYSNADLLRIAGDTPRLISE